MAPGMHGGLPQRTSKHGLSDGNKIISSREMTQCSEYPDGSAGTSGEKWRMHHTPVT